jgi:two-component sensor histidine kinase
MSELITNAARHAFGADHQAGEITVSVTAAGGQIVCGVHDTCAGFPTFTPGLGTTIVDSLAADLGGRVIRRTSPSGTSVELSLPQTSSCRRHGLADRDGDDRSPFPHAPTGARVSSLPTPGA